MKTKLTIIALGLPALVAACTSGAPAGQSPPAVSTATSPNATSAPPPPSATVAPTASTTPGPAPSGNSSLTGVWQSASCGNRKYVRTIQFDAEGTFLGRDLISPCPKGTACIWSGILDTKGKFEVRLDKISFTLEQPQGRPGVGQPFPTTMGIDRATSAPIETTEDGKSCVYTRAAGM